MKQLIITHKEIWKRGKYYFTSGGFPFQINEMSKLFSETRLICAQRSKGKQNGLIKISGKNLTISPITEPPFKGIKRQLFFCIWLLFHIRIIWNSIKCFDLIHAMIPGDIGLAGIIIAKMMKNLFLLDIVVHGVIKQQLLIVSFIGFYLELLKAITLSWLLEEEMVFLKNQHQL